MFFQKKSFQNRKKYKYIFPNFYIFLPDSSKPVRANKDVKSTKNEKEGAFEALASFRTSSLSASSRCSGTGEFKMSSGGLSWSMVVRVRGSEF